MTSIPLRHATHSAAAPLTDEAHLQRLALIGEIAAGSAHDINNLLTPLLGYAQLASEDPSNERRIQKLIAHVEQAASTASAIARSMVQLSRAAEAGTEAGACDVREVAESVFFCLDPRETRRGPRLAIEVESGVRVAMSHIELQQVIMNLVRNAQRATTQPGGQVTVEAECCSNGDGVRIEVVDNGVGMTKEQLEHIFEPWVQAGDETQRGSAGLGLAVCQRLVHRAEGSISARSALGKGTTFTITLKRAASSSQKAA